MSLGDWYMESGRWKHICRGGVASQLMAQILNGYWCVECFHCHEKIPEEIIDVLMLSGFFTNTLGKPPYGLR